MDMMDKMEQFDADSVPDLGGASVTGLLDGPFVVTHNGIRNLGGLMTSDGDGITFVCASRLVNVTNAFTLSIDDRRQTLTFENPVSQTTYVISPVDSGCMKEFWPQLQFSDLTEFKAFLLKLGLGVFGRIPETPELAAVVADDDASTVLGLYEYAPGQMKARQDGQWETLNAQSPEWETIEEGQWVPVLSGALAYWDDNEDKEKITADEIQNWVVGN